MQALYCATHSLQYNYDTGENGEVPKSIDYPECTGRAPSENEKKVPP